MSESSCGKCEEKDLTGCAAPIHHRKHHYVKRDLRIMPYRRTTKASVQEAIDKATAENGYTKRLEFQCGEPLKSQLTFVIDVDSKHMEIIYQLYHNLSKVLQEGLLSTLLQTEEGAFDIAGLDSAILWRDVPDKHPSSLVLGIINRIMEKHGHPLSETGKLGGVQFKELEARARAVMKDRLEPTGAAALVDMKTDTPLIEQGEEVKELLNPTGDGEDDDGGTVH